MSSFFLVNYVASYAYYEYIGNIQEFLNFVGSYDPCYDPPIHDLVMHT